MLELNWIRLNIRPRELHNMQEVCSRKSPVITVIDDPNNS